MMRRSANLILGIGGGKMPIFQLFSLYGWLWAFGNIIIVIGNAFYQIVRSQIEFCRTLGALNRLVTSRKSI